MSDQTPADSADSDRVTLLAHQRSRLREVVAPMFLPDDLVRVVEDLLTEQRDLDYDMHLAYRAEVVAEIAVRLDEEHDWEATAKWCGGTLRNAEVADTGEYESYIDIPGVGAAFQGCWITLDHEGRFRVRTEVDGPERPLPPVEGRPGGAS